MFGGIAQGFDGRTGGDLAVERQVDAVVGGAARFDDRAGHGAREVSGDDVGREAGCGPFRRALGGREHIVGHLDHFQGPGPVGQAAQEPALFQGHNQPVDAGLGLQVQGFLHLVERGRHAIAGHPVTDEKEELVLLFGEHGMLLLAAGTGAN